MIKAKQDRKTTKIVLLVGFTLLAAVFGYYGFSQNDHVPSLDESQVHNLKPQVTQIPKQVQPQVEPSSEKRYTVQPGDSYYSIAQKFKPQNVQLNEYVILLKNINLNEALHTSQAILIPSDEDLKDIVLPDVELFFDYKESEIVNHIKEAEGSLEFQSKNKRRLLGGSTGFPYRNSKFYPYRDMNGNYTIGYGHYLGKSDSSALKYKNGITKQTAHNLLLKDMERTYNDFTLLLQKKSAVNLSKEQQRILYEMSFTMGVDKLSRFNKLWKSIENDNPKRFKKEIKSSLWYRQVTNRADILLSSL